jgi:hypothetical protein
MCLRLKKRAPLLRGERPHERRECLEVAQNLDNVVERCLKAPQAQCSLEGVISPRAHRRALQAMNDVLQRACHIGEDVHFLMELRQVAVITLQPSRPLASRELLQPHEEGTHGNLGQRVGEQVEGSLLGAPGTSG